jgi:hypothetical protein
MDHSLTPFVKVLHVLRSPLFKLCILCFAIGLALGVAVTLYLKQDRYEIFDSKISDTHAGLLNTRTGDVWFLTYNPVVSNTVWLKVNAPIK